MAEHQNAEQARRQWRQQTAEELERRYPLLFNDQASYTNSATGQRFTMHSSERVMPTPRTYSQVLIEPTEPDQSHQSPDLPDLVMPSTAHPPLPPLRDPVSHPYMSRHILSIVYGSISFMNARLLESVLQRQPVPVPRTKRMDIRSEYVFPPTPGGRQIVRRHRAFNIFVLKDLPRNDANPYFSSLLNMETIIAFQDYTKACSALMDSAYNEFRFLHEPIEVRYRIKFIYEEGGYRTQEVHIRVQDLPGYPDAM